MENKYCIECEELVEVNDETLYSEDSFHYNVLANGDWMICRGWIVDNAPTFIPDGWQDLLVEPDEQEMLLMDRAAESLLLDFINESN